MRHKVLLATFGSLGDLHPFLALGRALREQGVEVIVAGAAEYRDKTRSAGLEFQPMRPSFADLERDLEMDRARLVQAVIAQRAFMFRKLVLPYVRRAYEDVAPLMREIDLVLASTLAFGARLAAEKHSRPWMAVVLQPFVFLSAFDPPVIPDAPLLSALLRRLPVRASGGLLALLKASTRPLLAPVDSVRRDLGLPRSRGSALFEGQFSASGTLCLYPQLLGAVQPDHPHGSVITGFAPFDSEDGSRAALDAGLAAFLDAGPPPLVFTLGSVLVHEPGAFFRESRAAAAALGRRAVLVLGPELHERDAPGLRAGGVYVAPYAPYSLLFRRAEVIVHHGGIGTLAQALAAGRPQLIVPFFADQPDNAARARRLGVARTLAPADYRAPRVERELAALLGEAHYAVAAARVSAQLAEEQGARSAAGQVIAVLETARPSTARPSAARIV